MIQVYLADDHEIVRHGVRRLIEESGDISVVGETSHGQQALEDAERDDVDVLVLDLSLPDMSGIEVLRRLKTTRPALPVVVLSMYPEDQYGLRLLSMGASAYLAKDRPPEELLEAIRRAHVGRRYITDVLAERAVRNPDKERPAHERLSDREYQVFTLLYRGHSAGRIAEELNLSPSTISTHIGHIKEKLGVSSVAEIVRYAARAGIVD